MSSTSSDEAHIRRLDVSAQLHTLTQPNYDSHTYMLIILSGQTSLIDKLFFYTERLFALRVVGCSHMEALQRDHKAAYLSHKMIGRMTIFHFEVIPPVTPFHEGCQDIKPSPDRSVNSAERQNENAHS